MAMKRIIQFLLITISICAWHHTSHAQINPTKIEYLDSLMAHQPKPILFLFSTDWCKYCILQKNQVRKNKKFKELEDSFYFVEFDAERKDKITFQGKEYSFKPSGLNVGTHELATTLNNDAKISYPTWILKDKESNTLFKHNGVLVPQQLNQVLKAIQEN